MKAIKYLAYTLMAASALSLASCAEEIEYTPGEIPEGAQVFFPVDTPTTYSVGYDQTSITIPVKRVVADEALTVEVLPDLTGVDDASQSLFTIPSSVSFAAGANEASVTIDFSELSDDVNYEIGLLLNDEANTTPYGYNTLYITIVKPSAWTSLGAGTWMEDGMFAFNAPVPVEILQSELNPNNFRIMMTSDGTPLYSDISSEYFEIQVLQPGDVLFDTPVTMEDLVYFSPFDSGVENSNYGETVWMYHPSHFTSMSSESAWTHNKVKQYQSNGLPAVVQCAPMYYLPIYGGGWDYSQDDDVITIVFPGAELSDYSLSAEYSGMRIAADNTTASAVIDFSYGADVASISYAFAAGNITSAPEEVINAIANGTADNVYTVDDLPEGPSAVSVSAQLEPGVYTVVAMPAGESGKLSTSDAIAYQFYFPGIGGTEIPECEIQAVLAYVSELIPDYASQYPDYSSLAFVVAGNEIASATYLMTTTELINEFDESEWPSLVEVNGYAFEAAQIESINKGGYASLFNGMDSNTSYTLLVSATNVYGKSALVSSTLSTKEAPAAASQSSIVKGAGMNGYKVSLISEVGEHLTLPVVTSRCEPLPKNQFNGYMHISESVVPFRIVK